MINFLITSIVPIQTPDSGPTLLGFENACPEEKCCQLQFLVHVQNSTQEMAFRCQNPNHPLTILTKDTRLHIIAQSLKHDLLCKAQHNALKVRSVNLQSEAVDAWSGQSIPRCYECRSNGGGENDRRAIDPYFWTNTY